MLFPEKISISYAAKLGGLECPLRKQVEYSNDEDEICCGYIEDPVGDREAEIGRGILQKYKGRLLVLASDECAIHCRFCFRRNIRRKKNDYLPRKLTEILGKDKTIKEVILSGGDPLMLRDRELKALFNAIPKHVIIRIHSRVPIAMPGRFTPALFGMLDKLGNRLVFMVHVNHPDELDANSKKIFERLKPFIAAILNQSVLLKDVNDKAEILAELSEKLFSQGVLPCYLHQLDKARGTAHFEVNAERATEIFTELKELLPGYLVPRFVKEVKGKNSKIWIT